MIGSRSRYLVYQLLVESPAFSWLCVFRARASRALVSSENELADYTINILIVVSIIIRSRMFSFGFGFGNWLVLSGHSESFGMRSSDATKVISNVPFIATCVLGWIAFWRDLSFWTTADSFG